MTDLTERILELEMIEARQVASIKIHAKDLTNSLRPSNLLKNAFSEVVSSKDIQHKALNTSIGIGAGWLIKRVLTRKSKSIFSNIAGKALQILATTLISKRLPKMRGKIQGL